ncbi:hypothetical protein DC3_35740 [Deinococcus cellulosilyticus NBRC 106333 = KACC 11606]|uniref:Uncharacterized protein n=2 Tax=Deinococcus cellulosilyticus TaxID=401558 RepID=A0A511N519_DEIC1|nr:hypothetical protein DC3_35740 [Deinococcus cellulosilyticus NBRC 106333 = KACC 11606]
MKPVFSLYLIALTLGMAHATTVSALTFEEQVKKADVILHVRIVDVKTIQSKNYPWQQYTLSVKETLKGNANVLPQVQDVPSFNVLGGDTWTLEGAPTFRKDEEWVVFLYKTPYDSPVVGFNQGMYRIQDGRVLGVDSLNLKNNELPTFKTAIREKL